jgi:methyl-accepting chemotaxis protein
MMQILKDSNKTSLVLAILFFVATLFAAYMLYALPGNLMLTSGYGSVLLKTYLAVAVAFGIGMFTVYLALRSKRELIVYKEKIDDSTEEGTTNDSQKTTISLESVKGALGAKKSTKETAQDFLQAVCKQIEAGQGAFYTTRESNGIRKVELTNGYALSVGEGTSIGFEFGEGLIGQAAAEGKTLYVDDIPEGYIKIVSGLGSASPRYLLIVPVKNENTVSGVVEIASFKPLGEDHRRFVEEAAQLLSTKLAM